MNKTLKEIIALADELNPNSYSNDIKAQWVNEVEAYIQTEIYNVAPLDVVSYTDYEESKDKELSLDAVNDKIYLTYLQAMIDFSNKEYAAFNNDVALYNTYIDTYAKWYVRTHGEGEALISGMYLSAYGIAVKHGFNGSEEEWLASLKGEKGDAGHGLEIKGRVTTYEELPDNAETGDIWQVGLSGLLYLWNGEWVFLGSYKGEQGPQGYPGEKGDKGEKGDAGDPGEKGIDGVGIADIYTTADDSTNSMWVIITLTNGEMLSFQVNNGVDGEDGYTPIKGRDYWTEADKAEILSEIPNGGTWTKLADITTTEEVGSVIATSEEFPDLPRCREFIARVMFPKSPTGANLALGTSGWYFNGSQVAFYYGTTTLNPSAITEVRVHITLAGRFIQAVGTQKASDIPALVAPANMLVGTRNAPSEITSLAYKLGSSENVLPVGTIVTIYGKVEG